MPQSEKQKNKNPPPSTPDSAEKKHGKKARLEEIESEKSNFAKIRQKLKNNEMDQGDLLVAIFSMLERVDEKIETITSFMKSDFSALEEENKKLRSKVIRLETEMVSNYVIVKGLNYNKDMKNGRETFQQTESQIKDLFKTAKAEEIVDIINVQRFNKPKKPVEGLKNKPTPIKVKLANERQVFNLFGKLSNLKGIEKYSKVSVSREIPPSLLPQSEELGKVGSKIRQKKGGSYKVTPIGDEMALFFRAKDSTVWEKIENLDEWK